MCHNTHPSTSRYAIRDTYPSTLRGASPAKVSAQGSTPSSRVPRERRRARRLRRRAPQRSGRGHLERLDACLVETADAARGVPGVLVPRVVVVAAPRLALWLVILRVARCGGGGGGADRAVALLDPCRVRLRVRRAERRRRLRGRRRVRVVVVVANEKRRIRRRLRDVVPLRVPRERERGARRLRLRLRLRGRALDERAEGLFFSFSSGRNASVSAASGARGARGADARASASRALRGDAASCASYSAHAGSTFSLFASSRAFAALRIFSPLVSPEGPSAASAARSASASRSACLRFRKRARLRPVLGRADEPGGAASPRAASGVASSGAATPRSGA